MSLTRAALSPMQAYEELMRFAGKFGEAPLRLAFHAAVPQSFRIDLLHLIKLNFVPEAKNEPTAEADLLLSPLCIDIGRGYFQFDSQVRFLLLDNLAETYVGEEIPRIERVANFLLYYTDYFNRLTSGSSDRLWKEYLETQRWVAFAFINPEGAALQFARHLQQSVADKNVVTRLQLGGLAASLSAPLAGYSHLLNYASALQTLETKGWDEANEKFGNFLKEEITVGNVTLRPATEIVGVQKGDSSEAQSIKESPDIEIQMLGDSPPMREVFDLISKFAPTDAKVLISGETGTGKKMVAGAIHQNSPRRNKPFVTVYCDFIDETLSDTELFGHQEGSPSDARPPRPGRFEEAAGGTLFLDNINEMPLSVQSKLLSVLESGEFTRIGGSERVKIDVRLVASTNINLESAAEDGKLRPDLHARLSEVAITLPPLRERKSDIPLLAQHFIKTFNELHQRNVVGLSEESLRILMNYDWEGNVRELRKVIETAVISGSTETILPEDLPEEIFKPTSPGEKTDSPEEFETTSDEFETTSDEFEIASDEFARPKGAFKNDVYISYARLDDAPFPGSTKGWVTQFTEALSNLLSQKLGRRARIWQDKQIQPGAIFDEEIFNNLQESAAFISIITPRYINSSFCLEELNRFREENSPFGNYSRVFKVVKTPVELEQMPEILRRINGFEFFKRDEQTYRPREFALDSGGEWAANFLLKVGDLAYEIAELLKVIENNQTFEIPVTGSPVSTSAIYLAETSNDIEELRHEVRRDLQDRGYTVLPPLGVSAPTTTEEYKNFVRENLQKCDFAVHMIGDRYGERPEDGWQSYVHLQTTVAAERDLDADFKRIIWIPQNLKNEDEEHQLFIERLLDTESSRVEILRTSLENLKSIIQDVLTHKKAFPLSMAPADASPNAPWIYVVSERSDLYLVMELEQVLQDKGYPIFSTRDYLESALKGDEEVNVFEIHNDYLTKCDAVLIYWNKAPLSWVRKNIFDLQGIKARREGRKFLAQGVFCDGDLTNKHIPSAPGLIKIEGYVNLPKLIAKLH